MVIKEILYNKHATSSKQQRQQKKWKESKIESTHVLKQHIQR